VLAELPRGWLGVAVAALVRMQWWFVALSAISVVACGSEVTSFRPADRGDEPDHGGPPAASYDVRVAEQPIADVRVWSTGGFISVSDEPMAQIGFEIRNRSSQRIAFDCDALELTVFDTTLTTLPPTRLTRLAPLGPPQVEVMPGKTAMLAAYFQLPVRPRAIDFMRVRWSLRSSDQRYSETTSFRRDDGARMIEQRRPSEPASNPSARRSAPAHR
jgi:hypothetical protein